VTDSPEVDAIVQQRVAAGLVTLGKDAEGAGPGR
jgi:hypothetical protein